MRATELFFMIALVNHCYWTNSAVILRNVMQEFCSIEFDR